MSYDLLRKVPPLTFGYTEVADALQIKPASARVVCTRYAKKGWLYGIKRNLYVLRERWDHLSDIERFQVANRIQVPSYVSLTTALSFYGVTTQVQQGYIESVCVQRTDGRRVQDLEFQFTKIAKSLYFGFEKRQGAFIATPEKAIVDALYLTALGKYSLDWSALDFDRLDREVCDAFLSTFPPKVAVLWRRYAPSGTA